MISENRREKSIDEVNIDAKNNYLIKPKIEKYYSLQAYYIGAAQKKISKTKCYKLILSYIILNV